MRQDQWDVDAAQRYDTPGEGMFAPDVLGPTVDFLAELAGDGRALEFAIGTGRVGVPLANAACRSWASNCPSRWRRCCGARSTRTTIPVVIGDMATTGVPGEFTLVYLVYNTISNLLTQDEQVECFRNAARHLEPGGRFVIELGVPPLR